MSPPGEDALVLVEVRGRVDRARAPSKFLSYSKKRRLAWLAEKLSRGRKHPVRVALVEIMGPPGTGFGFYWNLFKLRWKVGSVPFEIRMFSLAF